MSIESEPAVKLLIVAAGEIITCPNDHPMFKVLADQFTGTVIRASNFEAMNGIEQPGSGNAISRCPMCGEQPFRPKNMGGFLVKVDGEWRG